MNIGTQVLRKNDKLDARIGTIERIYSDGTAYVRWPAPRRIGGEFHHSRLKLTALIVADQATVDARKAAIKAENTRRRAENEAWIAARLARCTHECVDHYGTGDVWPLEPHQIRDGRCFSCGGAVREREAVLL